MVSIVSTIISRFTLSFPADKLAEYAPRPGEGEHERRQRIFQLTNEITLTPGKVGVVFTPRAA